MVFAADKYHDGGDDGGDEECEVDLHVGEEDEPFVACALFEFACGLGAAYAAGGIFAADAWEIISACALDR